MSRVLVKPTYFWRFMCWWIKIFHGPKDQLQVGTIFYGGALHIAFYFEKPGQRSIISMTCFTKEQALHFQAELQRQIERFDAFGSER